MGAAGQNFYPDIKWPYIQSALDRGLLGRLFVGQPNPIVPCVNTLNPMNQFISKTKRWSLSRPSLFLVILWWQSNSIAQEQPDILLIMADDMGYSDISCYGGEIETPTLNALASAGLRFTQFYNAARCCPTRASLLTGLYPHQTGVGKMVSHKAAQTPSPTQGYLNDHCVTIAEVLKPAGYRCYMSGKWHVGEFRPVWPIDRGFDHYYGLISGGMNYFDIAKAKRKGFKRVFARNGKHFFPEGVNFYSTDAFTNESLRMLQTHQRDHAQNPFFMYLAFNAPHWPLHAPEALIDKYRGQYLEGWDVLREQRYKRMIGMQLIDAAWALSPADGSIWNELTETQRQELDLRMATYAAMVDCMDKNIGRIINYLRKVERLNNTLVIFLSDNGACHEGGPLGGDYRKDLTGPTGTVNSYRTYGRSWSNASNTPFRKHKHWTHEGGVATPLIVHWPNGLRSQPGTLVDQVGHVVDLLPTFCDVTGAIYPKQRSGNRITPLAGRSLLPTFKNKSTMSDRTLFWEHMGNAAIRSGQWKLVRSKGKPWELYDLAIDRSELHNLANTQNNRRVAQLREQWNTWAENVKADQ